MRQIIPFAITIFSLTAAIIAGYLYFWFIPQTIERQVTQSFDRLGFEKLVYASKTHGGGKLVFTDITLDNENFSKIDSITVRYSLFAFLTNGQRAQSLNVKNLKLTGEITDKGEPSISGWDQNKSLISVLAVIPSETIIFENSSIDLLSPVFGGVNLKFDIQVTNAARRAAKIVGRAYSQQRKFGFDAHVEGLLTAGGNIDLKASVQQIQMLTESYDIRRFNADFLLKKDAKKPANISVEGTAGSVLWRGMPLGDVNINYESSGDNFNIIADGKTIGLQSIEFSSQINHVDGITHYETAITPPVIKDLLDYLDVNKIITNKPNLPDYIRRIKQPVLSFETSIDPQNPNYSGTLKFLSNQPNFEINGSYKYQDATKALTGSFEMPETTTAIEFSAQPPQSGNDDDAVIPESSPDSSPVTIDISSQGAFEITNWGTPKSALSWAFEIIPHNGEISYGALKLSNIGGKIVHSNKIISDTENMTLDYTLPLKDSIARQGKISLNLTKPNEPFIKQILLHVYGGSVKSDALPFDQGHLPENITLKIEDINLSDLLQDTRLGGLTMVGQMGGVLPLTLKDGKIMVKGGILQSQGAGIARISSYVSTDFFPGYTKEMQRIRDALENYHYDFFEIRFDGDFSSGTMMTLKGRGYNPDMPDKSPVDLNLQIETTISAFLSNLMKREQ